MKRKNRSNKNSVSNTIIVVLLCIALLGGISSAMNRNNADNSFDQYKTLYFIPSDAWAEDGSNYGAWCWSESGLPGSKFVLATDENEDGVFEFKIHKDYTGVNFIDLKPDTENLGLNWVNKREQTDNVDLPVDDKVYYHQYANEWSKTSDVLFTVTTEEMNVYLDNANQWAMLQLPVVYYFDKTGKNEPNFAQMTQCGAQQYLVTIPAGYTHVIFLEYNESGTIGSWDNVLNQTSDLIIPIGAANHFDLITNEWFVPETE